ncbi:ribonuclease P protein subunit [Methanimicrococcus sp. OttesenSCG-928-J09]|nr:ribonuclease P protein subunit [Methanimicrococcus sp. OttesenSCG-928-J09]
MTQIEITPAELPYHELIGLLVKVDSSCDPTLNGLSGFVVDETRNMITIETDDESRLITVQKKGTVFVFTIPERISQTGRNISVKIDGNITLSQPQNRIKNLKKSRK